MTRKTHHSRQLTRAPDGSPLCFESECDRAAGWPARPYSAWCSEHAPRDSRPIHGAAFGCPRPGCLIQTGTLTDFDRAQRVSYDAAQPVECINPADLGDLIQHPGTGVWLTPAGLRKRTLGAVRLQASRQASS